jgi:hypothetical protein
MEVIGQLHALAGLPQGNRPGIHWVGGCVNHRAGQPDTGYGSMLISPMTPGKSGRQEICFGYHNSVISLKDLGHP